MRILSSDSHVIEPPTIWAELVDPAFRDRVPRVVRDDDTDARAASRAASARGAETETLSLTCFSSTCSVCPELWATRAVAAGTTESGVSWTFMGNLRHGLRHEVGKP